LKATILSVTTNYVNIVPMYNHFLDLKIHKSKKNFIIDFNNNWSFWLGIISVVMNIVIIYLVTNDNKILVDYKEMFLWISIIVITSNLLVIVGVLFQTLFNVIKSGFSLNYKIISLYEEIHLDNEKEVKSLKNDFGDDYEQIVKVIIERFKANSSMYSSQNSSKYRIASELNALIEAKINLKGEEFIYYRRYSFDYENLGFKKIETWMKYSFIVVYIAIAQYSLDFFKPYSVIVYLLICFIISYFILVDAYNYFLTTTILNERFFLFKESIEVKIKKLFFALFIGLLLFIIFVCAKLLFVRNYGDNTIGSYYEKSNYSAIYYVLLLNNNESQSNNLNLYQAEIEVKYSQGYIKGFSDFPQREITLKKLILNDTTIENLYYRGSEFVKKMDSNGMEKMIGCMCKPPLLFINKESHLVNTNNDEFNIILLDYKVK
jgi:hypothetical protein